MDLPRLEIDRFWSETYSNGTDFRLASSGDVDLILSEFRKDSPRISLDIGCGTGQLSRELTHRGFVIVGVDVSREAIRRARHNSVVSNKMLCYIVLEFVTGDLRLLRRRKFWLITCRLVYAFISDKRAFLDRVLSLLANGGTFVLVTPLTSQVPREKIEVAIDRSELESSLDEYFEYYIVERAGLVYCFCKALGG